MADKRFDIPDVPQGIDPQLRPMLVRLRQALRDITTENGRLVDANVLLAGGSRGPAGPVGPAGPSGSGTTPDLTPPPTPTGLVVSAGLTNIFIEHDAPLYTQGHGHDRTVVYGAKWDVDGGAPEPTFSSAVVITEFQGMVFAYPTEPATTWCIWIKWRSNDGVLSVSPAGGTNGAQATTGVDVSRLLEALTGQITESQLFASLGASISRTQVRPNIQPNGGLERGLTGIFGDTPGWYVVNDVWGRVAYKASPADGTNIIEWPAFPVIPGQSYTISADTTRLGGTGSVWVDLAFIDASNAVIDYGASPASITAAHTFSEGAQARVDRSQGFVAPVGAVAARARFVGAFLAGCTLLGVRLLKVENGPMPATLYSAEQSQVVAGTEINALGAQYTVKIDTNGYVSGFGLANTLVNSAPFSSFIVRADSFAVASPSGPGIAPAVPFIVRTTPGTVNGVSYPAGVYIDSAFILDLTAAVARLGSAWVDDAKIANLSAAKLITGSVAVGQYIQSTGFISGSAGWRINGNGTAEFSGVLVRGTVVASAGAIGGATIAATYVQSSGYVANTTGWRLDNALGKIFANSALFRNAAGTRIFDLDATGTNPVLKIGSAVEILANGNATFGGILTADEVITTKNVKPNAISTIVAADAGAWGVVTATITVTAGDLPSGASDVPIIVIGSQDTVAVTFFDLGVNQGPSYTTPGNLVAAQDPNAGLHTYVKTYFAVPGTYTFSCANHGSGNAPDVANTRQRTIVALLARR